MQEHAMHLLTLVSYETPILRQATKAVEFPLSANDKQLIMDMKYSIQPQQLAQARAPWRAAAGMAANQWGFNRRIFMFCPTGDTTNEPEVIINPSYEPCENRNGEILYQIAMEGCFSVPLALGRVKRYECIIVNYQNEEGTHVTKQLRGWPARVWQHENDHLNGTLYEDKAIEMRRFASREEAEAFKNH